MEDEEVEEEEEEGWVEVKSGEMVGAVSALRCNSIGPVLEAERG